MSEKKDDPHKSHNASHWAELLSNWIFPMAGSLAALGATRDELPESYDDYIGDPKVAPVARRFLDLYMEMRRCEGLVGVEQERAWLMRAVYQNDVPAAIEQLRQTVTVERAFIAAYAEALAAYEAVLVAVEQRYHEVQAIEVARTATREQAREQRKADAQRAIDALRDGTPGDPEEI